MDNKGWTMMGTALTLLSLAGCGGGGENAAQTVEAAALPPTVRQPVAAVAEVASAPPPAQAVAAVETAGLLPPRARAVPGEPVAGALAFAFRVTGAPREVVGWYRAAAPGRTFRVESELVEGAERVLSGTTARPAGDFSVRLAADGAGGTTGMVLVTPRR